MSGLEFDMDVHELSEVLESGDDLVFWLNLRFDHNNRYLAARGVVGGQVTLVPDPINHGKRKLTFAFPRLNKSIFRLSLESSRKNTSVQANYRFVDGTDKPFRFSFDWDEFVTALQPDAVLRFKLHP